MSKRLIDWVGPVLITVPSMAVVLAYGLDDRAIIISVLAVWCYSVGYADRILTTARK